MFITQRYLIRWIYRAQELLEKWENQSKRQLCKEKSWIQGLAAFTVIRVKHCFSNVMINAMYSCKVR